MRAHSAQHRDSRPSCGIKKRDFVRSIWLRPFRFFVNVASVHQQYRKADAIHKPAIISYKKLALCIDPMLKRAVAEISTDLDRYLSGVQNVSLLQRRQL